MQGRVTNGFDHTVRRWFGKSGPRLKIWPFFGIIYVRFLGFQLVSHPCIFVSTPSLPNTFWVGVEGSPNTSWGSVFGGIWKTRVYIYIYIERERERNVYISSNTYTYPFLYIYVYTYFIHIMYLNESRVFSQGWRSSRLNSRHRCLPCSQRPGNPTQWWGVSWSTMEKCLILELVSIAVSGSLN